MCAEAGSGSLLGLPGVITKEPYTLTAFIRKGSNGKLHHPGKL